MNRWTRSLMQQRPRYVTLRERAGGKLVAYFAVPARLRPPDWPATYLLGPCNTLAEAASVQEKAEEYNRRLDAMRLGGEKGETPGSIPHLIRRLRADPSGLYRWKILSEGSRRAYDRAFGPLLKWSKSVNHPTASKLTAQGVAKLYAQYGDRPAMRKLLANALKKVLDVAVMEGFCSRNVVRDLPNPPASSPEADRVNIWPDDYFRALLEGALEREEWSIARMLAFQRYQAQRPSDAIRLHTDWFSDGWIEFRQQKKLRHRSGGRVRFRMDQRFRALLARTPSQIGPLSLRKDGEPHTLETYRDDLKTLQRALGLAERSSKHLRATGVLERAKAGQTALEIAQETGHSPASVTHILKHYLPQDDDLKIAASQKLEDWLAEQESNAASRTQSNGSAQIKELKPK